MRVALYPGTFDPVTNGHLDLIRRAANIFDEVVVAVSANPGKNPLFTLDERVELFHDIFCEIDQRNVRVIGYTGLTVKVAEEYGCDIMVRGLRAVSDFEPEFQIASVTRRLCPALETVFLTPQNEHTFISSTMVREVAKYGGEVTEFVHPIVAKALKQKLSPPQQPVVVNESDYGPGYYRITPNDGSPAYVRTAGPTNWELRECAIQWVPTEKENT